MIKTHMQLLSEGWEELKEDSPRAKRRKDQVAKMGNWEDALRKNKSEYLTPIGPLFYRKDKTAVLCECVCGSKMMIRLERFLTGEVISCGCTRPGKTLAAFAELKRQYPDIFSKPLYFHYYECSRGAKRRGIEWSLSFRELHEISNLPCHYCGDAPRIIRHRLKEMPFSGADRMDSSGPYSKSNCVPCCAICNRAKNTSTYKDFISWIQRVRNR